MLNYKFCVALQLCFSDMVLEYHSENIFRLLALREQPLEVLMHYIDSFLSAAVFPW